MYNISYYLLISDNLYSTCDLNLLSDFHTSTIKLFQLMNQIDLDLMVTSPFTRCGILINPSYQDESNECLFISDLPNSSIQFITLSIIITILTIYGHRGRARVGPGGACAP